MYLLKNYSKPILNGEILEALFKKNQGKNVPIIITSIQHCAFLTSTVRKDRKV